jgi:hypothetical protein
MGDTDSGDWADDPGFAALVRHVRGRLIPALSGTRVVISVVPEGRINIKFAVELGVSILLDKPLMVVVAPGTRLPDKLVKVADMIVEAHIATPAGRQAVREAADRFIDHGPDPLPDWLGGPPTPGR